jgi:hypothetical protein
MPLPARTQSLVHTIRYSNWQTNISPHTSPALPADGGGGVAFAQKGKAGGPTPASTPSDASAKKSAEPKLHPVPGKKILRGK